MRVYLKKTSYGGMSREPTSGDEWDIGDTWTSWDFGPLSIKNHSGYDEFIDLDWEPDTGDQVYLVIAVWSTGCSFGHQAGEYSEVFGGFKTWEEANQKLKDVKVQPYRPWEGYFESLDSIEVESFTLQP
jgi:hypothetical protein